MSELFLKHKFLLRHTYKFNHSANVLVLRLLCFGFLQWKQNSVNDTFFSKFSVGIVKTYLKIFNCFNHHLVIDFFQHFGKVCHVTSISKWLNGSLCSFLLYRHQHGKISFVLFAYKLIRVRVQARFSHFNLFTYTLPKWFTVKTKVFSVTGN